MSELDRGYRADDADLRLLLLAWYRRARLAQLAHADAAHAQAARARWLGIPVVVLSALVGTSVFATLTDSGPLWLQILTGMVSVTAAVLAALQTFLRADDVAGEHRAASRAFGALRREIGSVGALGGTPRSELLASVGAIRTRYDETSAAAPDIPRSIYDRRQNTQDGYFRREFSLWPEAERPAVSVPGRSSRGSAD